MVQRVRLVLLAVLAALLTTLAGAGPAAAAPANDNFASAQTMGGALPITVSGNDFGASAEPGEPTIASVPAQKSVWYRWTAPTTATYVVDTCDDGFTGADFTNPLIGVRTGTTLATLANVAEVNGSCSLRFTATAGTAYYLQIDYYEYEGSFNLTLRKLDPPANDNFATPRALGPALPLNVNATTVDSSWEVGEPPALGGASDSRSVWFSWTAPTTQRVRLSLCDKTLVDGALNDTTIVYAGATLATLTTVAELTSNDCNVDFPVTAGTTYRIGVSGTSPGEFDFVLAMKAAPIPANDGFASAQVVGPALPVNTAGNNDFATEEAGEPQHGDYPDTSRSVWFSWTAAVSGPVRVKACNPELEFFTSVYTGTTLATLTDVSEWFNYAPCSRFFTAVAGTTYRIAVAGGPFGDTHGPFALNLHRVAIPANDDFDHALDLGSGLAVTQQGTTVDSTIETDEPTHGNLYGSNGGTVWYRWTAPNDNAVILTACSREQPNGIAVFGADPDSEFTGLRALRQIDYDDSSCRDGTRGGRLAIAPVKGTVYSILVSPAEPDYESAFTLTINGTSSTTTGPNGKPPKAGFNLKKTLAKCHRIKGKGRKARHRRTRCIRNARRKAAIIKCKKIKKAGKRNKCIKKARKRFR